MRKNKIDIYVSSHSRYEELFGMDFIKNDLINNVVELNEVKLSSFLKKAVEMSKEIDNSILILFGDFRTFATPTRILKSLEHIENNYNYDVFYLTKYADDSRTNKFIEKKDNVDYYRVNSPHGVESLLISRNFKDELVKKIKNDDNLSMDEIFNSLAPRNKFYSTYPPILFPDVSFSDDKEKIVKTVLYRDVINDMSRPSCTNKNSSLTNYIWFITFLIFVIVVIYYLKRNMYKNKDNKNDENNKDL